MSHTTDAVLGRISAKKPWGSVFWSRAPPVVFTSYLYSVPSPNPGRNSSQIPKLPRWRIGCCLPSQRLKSPVTLTRRGVGRPDGEDGPIDAAVRDEVCAELVVRAEVVAFII